MDRTGVDISAPLNKGREGWNFVVGGAETAGNFLIDIGGEGVLDFGSAQIENEFGEIKISPLQFVPIIGTALDTSVASKDNELTTSEGTWLGVQIGLDILPFGKALAPVVRGGRSVVRFAMEPASEILDLSLIHI